MVKLEIVKNNNYEYILKDECGGIYDLSIGFWDIEYKPQIGDYIYMNEELLNPRYSGYSTGYTFGDLNSQYGKVITEKEDIDVIKIENDKIEIYLKRLYG